MNATSKTNHKNNVTHIYFRLQENLSRLKMRMKKKNDHQKKTWQTSNIWKKETKKKMIHRHLVCLLA